MIVTKSHVASVAQYAPNLSGLMTVINLQFLARIFWRAFTNATYSLLCIKNRFILVFRNSKCILEVPSPAQSFHPFHIVYPISIGSFNDFFSILQVVCPVIDFLFFFGNYTDIFHTYILSYYRMTFNLARQAAGDDCCVDVHDFFVEFNNSCPLGEFNGIIPPPHIRQTFFFVDARHIV